MCEAALCSTPPARHCNGDTLVVFALDGRCAEDGYCEYNSSEILCDQGCANGRCVGDDACEQVTCDKPFANYCADENTLRAFSSSGYCETGVCFYDSQSLDCPGGCVDGRCLDDACVGVSCARPFAAHCLDADHLSAWDGVSSGCAEGICAYGMAVVTCANGCEAGACVDDPCAGILCESPPAAYCAGDTSVTFESEGVCDPQTGFCEYVSDTTPCATTGCAAGVCQGEEPPDTDTGPADTEIQWIGLAAGVVAMGNEDGTAYETPVHDVSLDGFEMAISETTVAQYRVCVESGSCTAPASGSGCTYSATGTDAVPVNCVDWSQAAAYCTFAEGRLPTEAEWEFATRGTQSDIYPWRTTDITCDHAVMADCGVEQAQEVCQKSLGLTPDGLCDLAGNVWEWVEDDWHADYTDAPLDGTAWVDAPRSTERVVRGGSFVNSEDVMRASYRYMYDAAERLDIIGFRCAR
jgi:formylglycine-generating enzyme required for sulfatase activity